MQLLSFSFEGKKYSPSQQYHMDTQIQDHLPINRHHLHHEMCKAFYIGKTKCLFFKRTDPCTDAQGVRGTHASEWDEPPQPGLPGMEVSVRCLPLMIRLPFSSGANMSARCWPGGSMSPCLPFLGLEHCVVGNFHTMADARKSGGWAASDHWTCICP